MKNQLATLQSTLEPFGELGFTAEAVYLPAEEPEQDGRQSRSTPKDVRDLVTWGNSVGLNLQQFWEAYNQTAWSRAVQGPQHGEPPLTVHSSPPSPQPDPISSWGPTPADDPATALKRGWSRMVATSHA